MRCSSRISSRSGGYHEAKRLRLPGLHRPEKQRACRLCVDAWNRPASRSSACSMPTTSGPTYALIKEAAKAAAARDLAGEIKAAAQERVIQDAAELDCTKQRFPAFPTLRAWPGLPACPVIRLDAAIGRFQTFSLLAVTSLVRAKSGLTVSRQIQETSLSPAPKSEISLCNRGLTRLDFV